MLRGGGVAHGPKPRDFSTKLPKKLYDLGWRTALSYRYRKGELVVVEDLCESPWESMTLTEYAAMSEVFRELQREPETDWIGNPVVKSTVWVLNSKQTDKRFHKAHRSLWKFWPKDKVKSIDTLDVKNLLEGSRVVIEKAALDRIFVDHQSDLRPAIDIMKAREEAAADAPKMQAAVMQMTAKASVEAITASMSELVTSVEELTGKTLKETQSLLDSHER
jgi:large subunit ribosomal protein L4